MESLNPINEVMRKLLFSLDEGVCLQKLIVDDLGIPVDYEFLEINPAFEILAGFAKSDLINTKATEVYKCASPPFLDIFAVTASSGKPAIVEAFLPLTQKQVKIFVIPLDKGSIYAIYSSMSENNGLVKPLEESPVLNQIILKDFPNPIVIFNTDTTVVYVNRAFEQLTGFTSEEVKGAKMPYPWWPEERVKLFDKGAGPFPTNEIISCSGRSLVKKSGDIFCVEMTTIPVIKDEQILYRLSTWTDVTELRQTEQFLIESNSFSRGLLDNSPNPILLSNLDTSIEYVNRAFEELTGFTAMEVKGAKMPYPWWTEERSQAFNIKESKVVDIPPSLRKALSRAVRSLIKKNGETFWVEMTTVPVMKDGQILYRFSNWTDITERINVEHDLLKTEKTLRESERFSAILLDDSPNPITLLNPDGSIEYVNKAFEQLTGYNLVEIKGIKMPFPWWSKDKIQEYEKTGGNSLHINTYRRHERLLRNKNGDTFWAEMTTVTIKRSDTLNYRLGMWSDITQRKLAEEKYIALYEKEKAARQELQEEAKVRGLFIDVLAHELRTPLTPILASTSMLKDILEENHSAVETRLVTNIQAGAHTLTRRLEELLDLARFSRGTFKLNRQPTDLRLLVQQSIAHVQDMLTNRHQNLICEIADNLPIAEVDPIKLEQVIGNLLSNASKFSPDNVEIVIKSFLADSSFMFTVTDNGIGITKEEQNRLFTPYHRVEQDRQKFPGIGLGLAICRQIIEAHHGKIWITSQSNEGSTFHFSIPITPLL